MDALEQKKLDDRLLYASKDRDLRGIRKALKDGANPDVRYIDSLYRTPLHEACFYGYIKMVKVLLEYKANIEIDDQLDHTPLGLAAGRGQWEIVKILLEAKVNVLKKNNFGETALETAKDRLRDQKRLCKVIKLLTEAEANAKSNK